MRRLHGRSSSSQRIPRRRKPTRYLASPKFNGSILSESRERLGLTVAQAATKAGVPVRAAAGLEQGTADVDIDVFFAYVVHGLEYHADEVGGVFEQMMTAVRA